MTIGKHTLGVLCTAAVTVAVVGLSAAPAMGSTGTAMLTVKVSGGGSYTATTSKTILSDKGINVTCTTKGKTAASTGSGKIPNGTSHGSSPVKVGTVAKLSFNNCVGPLGKVSTTIKSTPYTVSVDSKTNSKGQTAGLISGVKVAVKMKGCSFMVTGSAPGYYTNGKHTLNLNPKLPLKALNKAQLSVSGVSGCFGLVKNGDHPTYVGTYTLSRKGTIKSS